MRRFSLALVAVALLGLVAVNAVGKTEAQDEPTQHPIVGSWRIALIVTGAMDQEGALSSFTSDGSVVSSVKPVSPAPAGSPFGQIFASLAHGSWTSDGTTSAAFTIVRLQTDEQGNYLGTVSVSAVGDMGTDGESVSGPFTYDVADPTGAVIASGTGTFEGSRIAVEPMATPTEGTPVT